MGSSKCAVTRGTSVQLLTASEAGLRPTQLKVDCTINWQSRCRNNESCPSIWYIWSDKCLVTNLLRVSYDCC